MNKDAFLYIDKQLYEVHLLLGRLVDCEEGYKLSQGDIQVFNAAEDILNKARIALSSCSSTMAK